MLSELNHPRVRDLAWSLQSPSLLAYDALPSRVVTSQQSQWLFESLSPHLRRLDQDPTELTSFLGQNPTRRVGRYFEQLIEYALGHTDCMLLATNHQLHHGKRVIGELDYLFEHDGEINHWETALKFYLQHRDGEALMDFVGPNAADTLGLKLDRILKHQLPMGQHPATTTIAGLAGRPISSRAYVRGYLFYHQSQADQTHAPSPIARDHLRGWWMFANESLPDGSSQSAWMHAEKPYWLAPIRLTNSDSAHLLSRESLQRAINDHYTSGGYPMLVVQLEERDGQWHEVSRGFGVQSGWPGVPDGSSMIPG